MKEEECGVEIGVRLGVWACPYAYDSKSLADTEMGLWRAFGDRILGMGLIDILFPSRCVGCDAAGSYLCPDCVNRLAPIVEPICPMCGRPAMFGKTHARCISAYAMEGLIAGCVYRGLAKRMIGKLKYRFVTDLFDTVMETFLSLAEFGLIEDKQPVVVGVPLHPSRLKWRGFNQADEIAKRIAENMQWQECPQALVRCKHTRPQMLLKLADRRDNVRQAFAKGMMIEAVKNRVVLLVDDVWTTGATMRECTKVLKRNGAKEVWGAVVAR